MYETMLKIRLFEERVRRLVSQGHIPGYVHLYTGQEAIAAGVSYNLQKEDYIVTTHRGHGHCIAKGAQFKKMMAEMFGKKTGYCCGKSGSMHISSIDLGIVEACAIVGGSLPLAVGVALTVKKENSFKVVVCYFGDGATNTGEFHESLNLASLWKLPVVFVCENNGYAMSTSTKKSTSVDSIAKRAIAYSISGITIDGNDVEKVKNAAKEAMDQARSGKGPTLLECLTYRWRGHHEGEPIKVQMSYSSPEELNEWVVKCPIKRIREKLIVQGELTEEHDKTIIDSIEMELDDAIEFAKESPFPSNDDIHTDLFAPAYVPEKTEEEIVLGDRVLDYQEAIREALQQEMIRDKRVIIIGEEIGMSGGTFRCTRGLQEMFGNDRVLETPISESAFTGAAIGAAVTGLRPIVEIMFQDFILNALDQIVNEAAKIRYMSGGTKTVPLVIRSPGGSRYPLEGRAEGPQHSQSFEAWFMHVPGLKVVVPSTPFDAKGLLISAIREDNPVMFCEHKLLYYGRGETRNLYPETVGIVPEEPYTLPFGKAVIRRKGKDITVVAVLAMVHKALSAAFELEKENISLEIIDPRTLVPLDKETILTSVAKTGRLIVAVDSPKSCSVASEIASMIAEQGFDYINAPIRRIAVQDIPIPFSPVLQGLVLPGTGDIIQISRELMLNNRRNL